MSGGGRPAKLDAAIARGLADVAAGRTKPAEELLDRLAARLQARQTKLNSGSTSAEHGGPPPPHGEILRVPSPDLGRIGPLPSRYRHGIRTVCIRQRPGNDPATTRQRPGNDLATTRQPPARDGRGRRGWGGASAPPAPLPSSIVSAMFFVEGSLCSVGEGATTRRAAASTERIG
jgi:hypothetical protein